MNIPLLSKLLNTTDKEFYARYGMVKKSFANLTNDVILVKKLDNRNQEKIQKLYQ